VTGRSLPWDWYPGTVPDGVVLDDTAYVETTFSFLLCRSEQVPAVTYGRGAASYLGTMFDLGPQARVSIGDYALVHGVRIICDEEVVIGRYSLLSWNVVLMDTYRSARDPQLRREHLRGMPGTRPPVLSGSDRPRPVVLGANVWIGFGAVVLPGVQIGDGAVVGAKSVVTEDVAAYTVVAGNPARPVRELTP
jgi:acetyltransferase-like isoleucine patch superfamily enzyme